MHSSKTVTTQKVNLPKIKRTTRKATMIEGIGDDEKEGIEIVRACIIEEVNFGKTIRLNTARVARNGPALDTGITSSVAGKLRLRKYVQELMKKAKREVKGLMKSNKVFKFGVNGML